MRITGKDVAEAAGGQMQGSADQMLAVLRQVADGTPLLEKIELALEASRRPVTHVYVRWQGLLESCRVEQIHKLVETRARSNERAKRATPGTWTLILE